MATFIVNAGIDVPGYSNASGTQLHLWTCDSDAFEEEPSSSQSTQSQMLPPLSGNQQWTWDSDGAVTGLMSGLCLTGGGALDR